MPRRASSATMRSMGRMIPVGLVMWSRSASLVRGVTFARTTSTTASEDATGNGMTATLTRTPLRLAT